MRQIKNVRIDMTSTVWQLAARCLILGGRLIRGQRIRRRHFRGRNWYTRATVELGIGPHSTAWAIEKRRQLIMVALCNRADHYILPCNFYLLLSFFPRLISAAACWMSTILWHMAWPYSANLECRSEMCCSRLAANTGRKNVAKNRHLGTIPQLCRAITYLRN